MTTLLEAPPQIGRHEIAGNAAQLHYILAGKAIFTLENAQSGHRVTYKVKKAESNNPNSTQQLWFVSYLGGADNMGDYWYIGTLRQPLGGGDVFYQHGACGKAKAGPDSAPAKGIKWLVEKLQGTEPLPAHFKLYHEGRCGRCGRRLTVPESIVTGMGPECAGRGGM